MEAARKEEMTYRIAIVEAKRENQPNDLVRLLGGQKNCFHIRKRPEGGLKKLKPLVAMIVDQKGNFVSIAPENVLKELHANRLDDGDIVTPLFEYQDLLGNWCSSGEGWWGKHGLDKIRLKKNPDGTLAIKTNPILNHRLNRFR